MKSSNELKPLWTPDPKNVLKTNLSLFGNKAAAKYGFKEGDYESLHRWSIEQPEQFWEEVWTDAKVIYSRTYERVMGPPMMPGTRWFEGSQLNFAENLLERGKDEDQAIRFTGETGKSSILTRKELKTAVARCAAGLKDAGVKKGDRVAAVVANCPEAVIGALASASLGAVWSSCSPDFGISGIHDRLGQIEPKILITVNAYYYNGKEHSCLEKIREVLKQIPSIRKTVVVPFTDSSIPFEKNEVDWNEFLNRNEEQPDYVPLDFDHPLYIMYSSGTTGLPKSIVHGAGGTLMKHLTEQRYHGDVKPGDRLFYFTTCGWMMWNWLISGLACGACLVLYDGSPSFPEMARMWKLIDDEQITHFGTSPKFLGAIEKSGYYPSSEHDLSSLKAFFSTGSPLPENLFEWFYEKVHPGIPLMSIAGGTDLIGCFMGGNPNLPVYSGELQCKSLGMDTRAFDPEGNSVLEEKGELVCCAPFPSMPIKFWNDPGDTKYQKAYFERFPGVWTHGDFIEITGRGGVIIYGRSDTVLNPGGVRIGTGEIYRPVEEMEEVVDSLVVGQPWQGDVRVVLFVVLHENFKLNSDLIARIKTNIRTYATPRHVPEVILEIPDVPRTISGKKVEKAVIKVIKGEEVDNTSALANPESLEVFENLRQSLMN